MASFKMALAAMAPLCWCGEIGSKSNTGIGVACGARRPVYGVGHGRREKATRSYAARPLMVVARSRCRSLTSIPYRISFSDVNGVRSTDCRRRWCTVPSRVQSNDVDISPDSNAYEETETEEEARIRNWKERGWAPWEELRTPEAQFAIDSLEEGEEEPIISWEDFQKLNRKQYAEKMDKELEEAARKEEEERRKSLKFEGSLWERPLVFTLTPPRDWPPSGWKVDAKELAYIRQAHTLVSRSVTLHEGDAQPDLENFGAPRWEMYLKQYDEWVAANKDRLEQEALEVDGEYYAGRRRTGEEYMDGMYELPFMYPGQHYWGVVTYVSLYEGAFVYFGGVHDGWVPIMDNDWYEIRKHIKVGMKVHVEVMAKRDPYRFRFPVELRFVDPNIDHLIFRRFKHPPIFGRREDINLDEVARESNRPYYPKERPEFQPGEEETEARVHPYVKMLWMVHEAEQMVLDDEEGIADDKGEEWATEEEDDPTGEWANEPGIQHEIDDFEIPTIILHVDEKYLNLEAARAEREAFKELREEFKSHGEKFEQREGRFERRLKKLNDTHQQRWTEEQEALVRDRTCRIEAGLALEEPGRYAEKSFWGKNPYDPREPQWRHDYWGDPSKLREELTKDREVQTRPEEAAEVEDDLLDDLGGDITMIREEGVDLVKERGFMYDDADAAVILGESLHRGAVNGTAAKSLTNVRDVDVEEGDWDFLDNSELENEEGHNEAGEEPKR